MAEEKSAISRQNEGQQQDDIVRSDEAKTGQLERDGDEARRQDERVEIERDAIRVVEEIGEVGIAQPAYHRLTDPPKVPDVLPRIPAPDYLGRKFRGNGVG